MGGRCIWLALPRILAEIRNRFQQVAGKLDCHGEGKDPQEGGHLVFDVHAITRLRDFKVHDGAVDDRGFSAGADEDDGRAHGEAQKDAADGIHESLGAGLEVSVEHVHAHMPLLQQSVGTGKQEERRVPVAHEVAHEGLLIGEYKARDDNGQFRNHDQQCKPSEAQRARENRGDNAHQHERQMQVLPPEVRASQFLRQFFSDDRRQKALHPDERHRHVRKPNEHHHPEGGSDQEGVDLRDAGAVPAQGQFRSAQDVVACNCKTKQVEKGLHPTKRSGLTGKNRAGTRPFVGEIEVVVDQVNQQGGDHAPGKQTKERREPVIAREGVSRIFHTPFQKKGTE